MVYYDQYQPYNAHGPPQFRCFRPFRNQKISEKTLGTPETPLEVQRAVPKEAALLWPCEARHESSSGTLGLLVDRKDFCTRK